MSKTLIKFEASWCGPCRAMTPIVNKLAAKHGLELLSVDIEESPDVADQWGVQSVPMFILLENEKWVADSVGAKSLSMLEKDLKLV